MSVIFSRQCEYALQSVLFLALKEEDEMTSIRELTGKLKIPYFFLAKILQDLTHKGLLKSFKGSGGGFMLARPANEIVLLDIIEAVDGNGFMEHCVLGFSKCSTEQPCALHTQWEKTRDEMLKVLSVKTVDQLADTMKKPGYSLN